MKYLKPIPMVIITSFLLVFACVTINIYFPAEQVESVAGEIVDEIRGGDNNSKDKSSESNESSSLMNTFFVHLGSTAWAQEVTTVSNPTIRALKERMKSRFEQMKPFYQNGALQEGDDGFVKLGDVSSLGLKDKRDLTGMVEAENKDRETLYSEVAKALKIDPGQIDRVGEIFAKEWQKSIK